jgi:hypothetical protein
MKAFIAACTAIGILWALDVEMNGGRYSDVVKKAVVNVLPSSGPLKDRARWGFETGAATNAELWLWTVFFLFTFKEV